MAPQPLPEELLGRICIYLCPHRQNPNDLPNPDEPCVRASKATLARLCRVSKRMLAIAQPILYHYYATGNIIGPLNPMVSDYPTADDKLPSFLRTIIHQPILAIHIRTLQLQSKSTSKTTTLNPHLRNGSSTPPSRAQKTRIAIHPWLRELAIILTPRTSHLMLGHSPLLPRTYIEPSSRLLPACTSLSFRSGVKGYNLAMMPPLLRMAPNLTSLQATDILGWHSEGLVDNAPLSLQKVRRLVAEELRMNEFSVMVRCDVSSHYEYLMPKSQHQTIQSLQEFYQLEELVMDQWAFLYHDNGSRGTKGLVTLLPASIQIVHLRYVYNSMRGELQQLALARLEQMRSMEAEFAKVGVQVEWGVDWGVDWGYPYPDMAMPRHTVFLVSAPVASPSTESSSSIKTGNPNTRRAGAEWYRGYVREFHLFRSNHLPG
ncbi:hypothetical protein VC83_05809 [Pseudogymnoascus destructans]|uniref:Uncharacterized protein n=1 Tax=Pseudogymnoascus destructans TaxID=655981 RepID=A0A177A693_9PEZI|nr:uncharacterized protein VC83_05809 [Pseudogymnoascus destructans]OAF56972.1 hypothetical protein VC83_05809 [Pseudogymnoascus destructans]